MAATKAAEELLWGTPLVIFSTNCPFQRKTGSFAEKMPTSTIRA